MVRVLVQSQRRRNLRVPLGFFGLVFVLAPGTSVLPFPHTQKFVNASFDLEYGIEEAYIVCAITFKNRMRNYLLIASINQSIDLLFDNAGLVYMRAAPLKIKINKIIILRFMNKSLKRG